MTVGGLVTTAQDVTIVITLLVPIVTAIAGILGVMLQDWRVRRSQAGRRRLALEDARQQVTFAAEWWNAQKLVADSPAAVKEATSRAATWLEQASAQVSGSEIPVAGEKRRITFRRLLLFYPLQGISANIIRGGFYFSLGVLIVYVGGIITDILEFQNYVISDLFFLMLIALVALGLRFWAVYAQNPKGKKRKLRPEAIRHALLFYRLGGFSASLVRIVFYSYTIFAIASIVHFLFWGDLKRLPVNIGLIVAFTGFGVGFRHWAAVLGTARKNNTTKRQLPSGASVQGTETSPIGNQWWQRIPDHGTDQGRGL